MESRGVRRPRGAWFGFGFLVACLLTVRVVRIASEGRGGGSVYGGGGEARVDRYQSEFVRWRGLNTEDRDGEGARVGYHGDEGSGGIEEENWKGSSMEMDADLDCKEVKLSSTSQLLAKFRVIVMTMDRPWALDRLLKSLNDVDFQNDQIILDIWIDRSREDELDEKVLAVAREFEFKHGKKVIYKRTVNAGLYRQWVMTWTPSSAGEDAILLEDDLEVSPFFYAWLKRARQKYGKLSDIAAFTLQRADILASKPLRHFKVPDSYPVFFYQLLGSWGLSPNREHWTEFSKFFREKAYDPQFHPYVDGLIMTDWFKPQESKKTMWTMFFIWWCEQKSYYTVYVNLPNERTLSSNWQEGGLHYSSATPKVDFQLLTLDDELELRFPDDPIKLNWHGYVVGGGSDPSVVGKHVNSLL